MASTPPRAMAAMSQLVCGAAAAADSAVGSTGAAAMSGGSGDEPPGMGTSCGGPMELSERVSTAVN